MSKLTNINPLDPMVELVIDDMTLLISLLSGLILKIICF